MAVNLVRCGKGVRLRLDHSTNRSLEDGREITDAEWEFALAMYRWRVKNHRHPDCRDVLRVAKQLGYEKQ